MEGAPIVFKQELALYQQKLPELMPEQGKWVLIHRDEFGGVFAAYEDAIKEGYDKYGALPFLVKQIESEGQAHFFTREICPT